MSNRDGAVSFGELEKEGFVYSEKDRRQYKEISRNVKSLAHMREKGKRELDELGYEDHKDLSHTGEKIEQAGLIDLGPFDLGGMGKLDLALQHPVDYVSVQNPRKKRSIFLKEFNTKGGEQFCEDHNLDLIKRTRIIKYLFERRKKIKIRDDGTENRDDIDRFIREGQVGKVLRHENTPNVFYADEFKFAMPYYHNFVPWTALVGRNERERFEIGLNVVKTFAELEESAKRAKKRLIQHRDEKPGNFMSPRFNPEIDHLLTDEERYVTKVIDWGLASVPDVVDLEDEVLVEITQDKIAGGTVLYMPPEIAHHGLKASNTQSQIWGLCASLWHFITGVPTSVRLTEKEDKRFKMSKNPNALGFFVIGKLLKSYIGGKPLEKRLSVTEANSNIPEGSGLTECLVNRGMAIDPKRRYKTVGAFYKDLLKVRKALNSKKMKTSAGNFQIPIYQEPTAVFSTDEVNESVEVLQRAREEGKKEIRRQSTRTKKFDDLVVEDAKTLQQSVDLAKNGIATQGATTLREAVEDVGRLGADQIEVMPANTLQEDINNIQQQAMKEDERFGEIDEEDIFGTLDQ